MRCAPLAPAHKGEKLSLLLHHSTRGIRLDSYWVSVGLPQGPYWVSTGPLLAFPGTLLGSYRTFVGPLLRADLDFCWTSVGPLPDVGWTPAGPRLDFHQYVSTGLMMPSPGPLLGLYCTSIGILLSAELNFC